MGRHPSPSVAWRSIGMTLIAGTAKGLRWLASVATTMLWRLLIAL
jgi:hypothetical protein